MSITSYPHSIVGSSDHHPEVVLGAVRDYHRIRLRAHDAMSGLLPIEPVIIFAALCLRMFGISVFLSPVLAAATILIFAFFLSSISEFSIVPRIVGAPCFTHI